MRSGSTGTCIKGSGWLFVHRNSLYNPLPWTRWGVVPLAFGVFGVGHKKGIALRGQPNTNVCYTLRLMGIFWEVLSLCGSETMSDIFAIWFGAHTRKFETFCIFENACGREHENSKIENSQSLAKCCRLWRRSICTLRKFAFFRKNLHILLEFTILAKMCRFAFAGISLCLQ